MAKFSSKHPYTLSTVRLPVSCLDADSLPAAADGLVGADIVVERGKIRSIRPPGNPAENPGEIHDLGSTIVWPCPVDCHTHLDKGQIWARTANPSARYLVASVKALLSLKRRSKRQGQALGR